MMQGADFYQAFFHSVSDAVFVVDTATHSIVELNLSARRTTGLRAGDPATPTIDRLFHPPEQVISLLNAARGGGTARCDGLILSRQVGQASAVQVNVTRARCDAREYVFLIVREVDSEPLSHSGCAQAAICGAGWLEQQEFPTIIGHSEKIRDVCRLIGAVAKSEATVLIQGESGTGKEIIANAIHAHSHRCRGPFVKVNCAALTESLFESELFGHVRGAFTGAIRDRRGRFKQADGGTILLDEIGSLSLSAQAKLLRVLQEHEFEPVGSSVTLPVDVRVIAATNIDLARATGEGRFREDLYYRLNVFTITLPPLRERKEDIPSLAQYFLNRYSESTRKAASVLAPATVSLLISHDWPGNVRELENAVEHAVIVEQGSVVLPGSLPGNLAGPHAAMARPERSAGKSLREKLILLEREILLDTLARANGVKKRAADMLGIDARNLPYLLRKHRLTDDPGARSSLA